MKQTLPLRRIAVVAPAIFAILIALIGILVVNLGAPSASEVLTRYQREADRALAVGDRATALVCAQRLMQLDPSDPMNEERLALANHIQFDAQH